jgi:hypothetical protein
VRPHTGGLTAKEKNHEQQTTHTAYVVTEPKEGCQREAVWHAVGAIWPHRNGKGDDLVIPAGMVSKGLRRLAHSVQAFRLP